MEQVATIASDQSADLFHVHEHRKITCGLQFMERIATNAQSVIIGSATPIQPRATELHELVAMLAKGTTHVLGREGSRELVSDTSMRYLTGEKDWPTDRLTSRRCMAAFKEAESVNAGLAGSVSMPMQVYTSIAHGSCCCIVTTPFLVHGWPLEISAEAQRLGRQMKDGLSALTAL